ncbi:MAG: sigma-70 family RNA polymerase sigma factor [Spirochaetaceae bacterium]|nr:sigma-70 family RNA polymerase sigma factor [Spirochaetaceae bacterium]
MAQTLTVDIEAWYKKYLPLVFRRCRIMLRSDDDAFDAAQDVFVRALRARHIHGAYPSTLLYTIATRVCLNRLRSRQRHAGDDSGELFDETAFPVADASFDEAEARLVTETIMRQTSEETRALLYMYFVDGMSLEETGRILGLSASGVRKRIVKFRERMEKHG